MFSCLKISFKIKINRKRYKYRIIPDDYCSKCNYFKHFPFFEERCEVQNQSYVKLNDLDERKHDSLSQNRECDERNCDEEFDERNCDEGFDERNDDEEFDERNCDDCDEEFERNGDEDGRMLELDSDEPGERIDEMGIASINIDKGWYAQEEHGENCGQTVNWSSDSWDWINWIQLNKDHLESHDSDLYPKDDGYPISDKREGDNDKIKAFEINSEVSRLSLAIYETKHLDTFAIEHCANHALNDSSNIVNLFPNRTYMKIDSSLLTNTFESHFKRKTFQFQTLQTIITSKQKQSLAIEPSNIVTEQNDVQNMTGGILKVKSEINKLKSVEIQPCKCLRVINHDKAFHSSFLTYSSKGQHQQYFGMKCNSITFEETARTTPNHLPLEIEHHLNINADGENFVVNMEDGYCVPYGKIQEDKEDYTLLIDRIKRLARKNETLKLFIALRSLTVKTILLRNPYSSLHKTERSLGKYSSNDNMMEFLNSENYISKIFGGADSETKTSLVEQYAFNEFQIQKLNHANNISESNIQHYERTGAKFLTKEETLYSTILHIITGTESHWCNGMTSSTFKSNSPAGMFMKLQTLLTIYPVVKLDNVHRSSNIQVSVCYKFYTLVLE
ncbi:hypothetical protein M8J77_020386 [Diaphorina citri]|nr:hypothetical protein M8J77_020386 [Diaphorina citri]